jgi:hypothetical protein
LYPQRVSLAHVAKSCQNLINKFYLVLVLKHDHLYINIYFTYHAGGWGGPGEGTRGWAGLVRRGRGETGGGGQDPSTSASTRGKE